jgi:hypothetical protein
VAVLSLALAVGAQAKRGGGAVDVPNKVVIHKLTPTVASGEVSAKVNECTAKRKVSLVRLNPEYVVVGHDTTNEKGNWDIREPLTPGSYSAMVGIDRVGDFRCDQVHSHPVDLP